MAEEDDDRRHRRAVPLVWLLVGGLVLALGAAIGVIAASGGDGTPAKAAAATAAPPQLSDAQTVRFQQPADPGPDPFTEPADTEGAQTIEVSTALPNGTFGGTGSNAVCDRDKLIRALRDDPGRLRAWATVLGLKPSYRTVARYIARLHPVTLKRDVRVTNHAYLGNGQVSAFQSILQAGTAVLVDQYGRPVVRCRCGNPLTEPAFVPTATCYGCPPRYRPPEDVCDWWGRHTSFFRRYYPEDYYANADYDLIFVRFARRGPYVLCYVPYPDPPRVTVIRAFRAPVVVEPAPAPATAAPSTRAPDSGSLQCYPPRSQLEFERCVAAGYLGTDSDHGTLTTPTEPPDGGTYPPAEQHTDTTERLPVCDPIDPHPPCRES